jgi:hypothetical protein
MRRGWFAVVAATAVGAVVGGSALGVGVADAASSRCAARELKVTFSMIPFSQGLGSVGYTLTVTNHSARDCAFKGPVGLQLLGAGGRKLPTKPRGSLPGGHPIVLGPGQWAQANAKFSPDIAAKGEGVHQCEPVAHALRLTIAGASVTAPMDPSPVCQFGKIYFSPMQSVAFTLPCTASEMGARFERVGKPVDGRVSYRLELFSGLPVCATNSIVSLRLLGAGGRALPTRVTAGVSSPYLIPAGAEATAIASFQTKAGAGEPKHGGCEALASSVAVAIRPGGGTLDVPIKPPLRACHHGAIDLSGLYTG